MLHITKRIAEPYFSHHFPSLYPDFVLSRQSRHERLLFFCPIEMFVAASLQSEHHLIVFLQPKKQLSTKRFHLKHHDFTFHSSCSNIWSPFAVWLSHPDYLFICPSLYSCKTPRCESSRCYNLHMLKSVKKGRIGPDRDALNLENLQRGDREIVSILFTASHVVAYRLSDSKKWEQQDTEGPLFIVQRASDPFHRIIILNRRNIDNFHADVRPGLQLEEQQNFLFYKLAEAMREVSGLWFYDKKECSQAVKMLSELGGRHMTSKTMQSLNVMLGGRHMTSKTMQSLSPTIQNTQTSASPSSPAAASIPAAAAAAPSPSSSSSPAALSPAVSALFAAHSAATNNTMPPPPVEKKQLKQHAHNRHHTHPTLGTRVDVATLLKSAHAAGGSSAHVASHSQMMSVSDIERHMASPHVAAPSGAMSLEELESGFVGGISNGQSKAGPAGKQPPGWTGPPGFAPHPDKNSHHRPRKPQGGNVDSHSTNHLKQLLKIAPSGAGPAQPGPAGPPAPWAIGSSAAQQEFFRRFQELLATDARFRETLYKTWEDAGKPELRQAVVMKALYWP
eukprot:g47564.t1